MILHDVMLWQGLIRPAAWFYPTDPMPIGLGAFLYPTGLSHWSIPLDTICLASLPSLGDICRMLGRRSQLWLASIWVV
jgi:hypothetical protein